LLAAAISQSEGSITTPTFTTTKMWSYRDFAAWPETSADSLCAKGLQSPVDIITAFTQGDTSLTDLQLFGPACKSAMFETTPHKWKVEFLSEDLCMDKMWITWKGVKYYLQFFDFHSPSETNVDGMVYDMEAHFHHADMNGRSLIIAVLMTVGAQNDFFQHIMLSFPITISEKEAEADVPLNPYLNFFPKDRSYWAFNGSLTEPPCTTNVQWIVFKTPVAISAAQRNAYRAAMTAVPGNALGMNSEVPLSVTKPWSTAQGINNRPVQPLGGRVISEFPKPQYLPDYAPPPVQLNEVISDYSAFPAKQSFFAAMPLSAMACVVFGAAAATGYFLKRPLGSTRSTALADDQNVIMHPGEHNEGEAD
jgi:carbonic anhydrase